MSADACNDVAVAPVHFVHLSDSHVQSADPERRHLRRLEAAVNRICALSKTGVPLDFVVHSGDLMDDADTEGATAGPTIDALAVLTRLPVPWFMLGGNHDRCAYLQAGSDSIGESGCIASVPYPLSASENRDESMPGVMSARIKGVRLVFLNLDPEDGTGDLHGRVAQGQHRALEQLLSATATWERVAIFSHYPLLAQEAVWTGQPAGGDALAQLISQYSARVAGVFAGHVHRSIHHLSNGVLHVSAPPLSRHFLLWPGQLEHAAVDDAIVGWHYVTVDGSGTRVQHHAFEQGADTC